MPITSSHRLNMKRRIIGWIVLLMAACLANAETAAAQSDAAARGSRNVALVNHVAVEGGTGAVEVEQDPARPYAYLSKQAGPGGFVVMSLAQPDAPQLLLSWDLEGPSTSQENAGRDVVYFKLRDRYYLVQAFQPDAAHPQAGLGAVIFDVTGLPDAASVREVARIREPTATGGFHSLFAYKHSDGRALLFATGGGAIHVYDLERLLATGGGLVTQIDTPEQLEAASTGYDAVFVGFEPDTGQDRFYGAGAGGYYIYDVTDPTNATLLTSISSAAVQRGRAIAPTPDGRYAVTAASYRTAPLRIFDLHPGLDKTIPRIRTAVGAWTANWRNEYTDLEVRWPFVFVTALEDGLQVFNINDPLNPYTDAFYRTAETLPETPANPSTPPHGAVSVDVRNSDGLIVVSDLETGFWAFYLETFEGWHGHGWGLPNMSSAQDWDNGPDGAR